MSPHHSDDSRQVRQVISAEVVCENLGSGAYGSASIIELTFDDDLQNPLPAVVKRYHPPKTYEDELLPIHAVCAWKTLRNLGLSTPTLYRKTDARTILMPFLGDRERICVGPNNPERCSLRLWGETLPDKIPNLHSLFKSMVADVLWAAKNDILIGADTQFFLWTRVDQNVTHVWADFDNVDLDSDLPIDEKQFLNIRAAYIATDKYIQSNVCESSVLRERNRLNGYALQHVRALEVSSERRKELGELYGSNPLKRWAMRAPQPSEKTNVLRYPPRS